MEWAIGKNYDIYRPNTGKLLLPGSKIWWEMHYHAVGEEIRRPRGTGHLPVSQGPGTEIPHASDLVWRPATTGSPLDIRPNTVAETQGFHVLKSARLENFQPHMHLRGKAMSLEAILPDGTKRC